jgi:hypothetical protein
VPATHHAWATLTTRLREQVHKRGIGDQDCEDILTNMTAFSGYGFVRGMPMPSAT